MISEDPGSLCWVRKPDLTQRRPRPVCLDPILRWSREWTISWPEGESSCGQDAGVEVAGRADPRTTFLTPFPGLTECEPLSRTRRWQWGFWQHPPPRKWPRSLAHNGLDPVEFVCFPHSWVGVTFQPATLVQYLCPSFLMFSQPVILAKEGNRRCREPDGSCGPKTSRPR